MGIIVLFWLGIRRSRSRGRTGSLGSRTGPRPTRASLAARVAALIHLVASSQLAEAAQRSATQDFRIEFDESIDARRMKLPTARPATT